MQSFSRLTRPTKYLATLKREKNMMHMGKTGNTPTSLNRHVNNKATIVAARNRSLQESLGLEISRIF